MRGLLPEFEGLAMETPQEVDNSVCGLSKNSRRVPGEKRWGLVANDRCLTDLAPKRSAAPM